MEKKLICINCPIGCHLTAERSKDSDAWSVTGNRCPRGELYARNELTDPRRVVTATVRCNSELMRSPMWKILELMLYSLVIAGNKQGGHLSSCP